MTALAYAKVWWLPLLLLAWVMLDDGGFAFVLLLLLFAVVLSYQLIRMALRRGERKARAAVLARWVVVVFAASAVLGYWSVSARREAEAIAVQLQAHAARTGAYPASLVELGRDDRHVRAQWGIHYALLPGRPTPSVSEPSAAISNAPFPNEPISNEPISNEPMPNEPIPREPIPIDPIPSEPVLSYPAYYLPLTRYEYDFDRRQWRLNAY